MQLADVSKIDPSICIKVNESVLNKNDYLLKYVEIYCKFEMFWL